MNRVLMQIILQGNIDSLLVYYLLDIHFKCVINLINYHLI